MQSPDYSISTPENVDLHLELAGIGNRILATMIDTVLGGLVIIVLGLSCVLIGFILDHFHVFPVSRNQILMVAAMCAMFVAFVIQFGYNILFEGIWHGQTPGKRIAQIRVIEANGQPVGWAAVCIRNLIRMIDVGVLLIGLLAMLIDKNERRLGDLAAGTLVIRERKTDISTGEVKLLTEAKPDSLLDIGRITPEEYDLLARFLKRRVTLAPAYRPVVSKKLETYFREKLNESNGAETANANGSEAFLEKVFLSYQARGIE
jgi:uncharacterized RDD family membrane protein YckC